MLIPLGLCLFLVSCTDAPPKNPGNICSVFEEYPKWYWEAKDTQKKWGMPVYVQAAIIYQESRFNAQAKPDRTKLLWVIPWKRPTSAYGYSQALDDTWKSYERDSGNHHADKDDFGDASDFVGWYGHQVHKKTGVSVYNAYAQYLAYHEGIGGYERGTYKHKKWLIDVAKKVQRRSNTFRSQLRTCESKIKKPWWKVF